MNLRSLNRSVSFPSASMQSRTVARLNNSSNRDEFRHSTADQRDQNTGGSMESATGNYSILGNGLVERRFRQAVATASYYECLCEGYDRIRCALAGLSGFRTARLQASKEMVEASLHQNLDRLNTGLQGLQSRNRATFTANEAAFCKEQDRTCTERLALELCQLLDVEITDCGNGWQTIAYHGQPLLTFSALASIDLVHCEGGTLQPTLQYGSGNMQPSQIHFSDGRMAAQLEMYNEIFPSYLRELSCNTRCDGHVLAAKTHTEYEHALAMRSLTTDILHGIQTNFGRPLRRDGGTHAPSSPLPKRLFLDTVRMVDEIDSLYQDIFAV